MKRKITHLKKTTFFVVAFVLSANLLFSQTNYYLKSGLISPIDASLLSNYTTDMGGGAGTEPTDFAAANNIFNLRNNTSASVTLTVDITLATDSKFVVGDGTNAIAFTIPTGRKLTGRMDVSHPATAIVDGTIENNGAGTSGLITSSTANSNTLTINGTHIVSGTSAATVFSRSSNTTGGTIFYAASSNLNITSSLTTANPFSTYQTGTSLVDQVVQMGNVTFNPSALTSNGGNFVIGTNASYATFIAKGNLTIENTGADTIHLTTTAGNRTYTIEGNFSINGGIVVGVSNATNATGSATINLSGDFNLAGGVFDFNNAVALNTSNTGQGRIFLNIAKNFNHTAGTLKCTVVPNSTNNSAVNVTANPSHNGLTAVLTFNGSTPQTFSTTGITVPGASRIVLTYLGTSTLTLSGTIPTFRNFSVTNAAGTIALGANDITVQNFFNNVGIITGSGNITIASTPGQITTLNSFVSGSATSSTQPNIVFANTNGVTVNSGQSLRIAGNATINPSVTVTNSGSFVILPTGSLAGNYAGITGTTTLQASVIGQRGNRVFANPFSTTQTLSTVATNNSIVIATTPGVAGVTDARAFDPSLGTIGQWTNLTSTVAANQAYALFIRGLTGDLVGGTGLTYNNNPTAFTYNVSGTLNGNSVVLPTNATAGRLSIVGNPYAAPVNTQALTGGVSLGYQVYQITAGADDAAKRARRGSWVTVVASNNTTTIPTLGALAFQASTANITVANTDINTSGTAATNLFGTPTNNSLQYLDIAVKRNNEVLDNMIVRTAKDFTANGTDRYDLTKMGNDVVNVYSLTPDGKRLALDARNIEAEKNTKVQMGIRSTAGNYQLTINHNSLPQNVTATLVDKYQQTETPLNANTDYNFSITADAASQGEQRFEIVFSNSNTASIIGETPIINSNKAFKVVIAATISSSAQINMYVENAVNNKAQVIVRDLQGRTVSSSYISNGNNSIQAPTSKGMYVVEINDGIHKQIEKIIR
jgi:hypothetical protein